MARILLILKLQVFFICVVQAQSFTVDDLVTLSSLSPKKFDNFMDKKGYLPAGGNMNDSTMALNFFEKKKEKKKSKKDKDIPADTIADERRIGLYKESNAFCFALFTTSRKEYDDGLRRLKNSDFIHAENEDTSQAPLFFQKKNVTVQAIADSAEGRPVYKFLLKKTPFPGSVQFAEDLLNFDSHELLASYFGEENIKKDVYFFSEKKVRKCSVLFGNSNKQSFFVWEDEDNLCKLSYILISGILPTKNAVPFNENIGRNIWEFRSGIYSGMSIRDLIRLNESDFNFYGINSEFSLMVEPANTGNIDFEKTGIILTSLDGESPFLKKLKISATAAAENHIALHVFYIMLTP